MKKALALALTTSLFIAGCASAGSDKKEMAASMSKDMTSISQAEADVKSAKAVRSEWRILDKAAGKKAVSLSKLLNIAKAAADEGKTEEANRIAAKISKFAKIGISQGERYAGVTPYYN